VARHVLLQLFPLLPPVASTLCVVQVSRQQILVLGSYEVVLVESQALREHARVAVLPFEIKLGDSMQFIPCSRPKASQLSTTVYLTGSSGGLKVSYGSVSVFNALHFVPDKEQKYGIAAHSYSFNFAQSLSVNALPPYSQHVFGQMSEKKSVSFMNSIHISFFWLGMGVHDPTCSLPESPILHPSLRFNEFNAGLTVPDLQEENLDSLGSQQLSIPSHVSASQPQHSPLNPTGMVPFEHEFW